MDGNESHFTDSILMSFHFKVVVDGISEELHFASASGFDKEIQVENVQEGGVNGYAHRLPKSVKFNNLVLKRALRSIPAGDPLVKWTTEALDDFNITTRTVTVSILNSKSEALRSWSFFGAYPVKASMTELDAKKNEVVMETMEFAYKYFKETKV